MSSQQADEKFVEYYHLEHDPFQARVPGFRFFPAQRGNVLNDLHKQARFGSLVQVVTGPLGAGKTLLRQALQASIDKERIATVVLMGRDVAGREQLLQGLAGGVGAHSFDEDAVREQIGLFNQHGQDVYLLVDDAEQLADESLDVLERVSRIAGESDEGSPQGVRVILFAAPDLLEQLEESGRAEGWQLHRLQPYSLHETRDYLAQRLEGAGQGIELLGDDQIACIHEESAGWPGQINSAARAIMLEGMREDEVVPVAAAGGMKLPRMHMMGLGAVGLLLVLGVLFNTGDLDGGKLSLSQGKDEAPQPQSLQLPLNSGTQSVSRDPVASMAVPVTPPPVVAAAVPAAPAAPVTPAQPVEPVPAPATSTVAAAPEPVRPVMGEPVSKPAQVVASKPVPAPAPVSKPAPAPVVASKPAPAPAPAPVAKPAPAQVPVVASKPAPAPVPAPVVASKPVPAPVVKPVPVPAPVVASKPVVPGGSGNGGWYLSQDGNNYTLQLLAVSGEASAQKAVAEGGADYRYFRKEVGGKPMYVVTYGRFADRNVAMSAVSRLPARFQAGKPVPQSMATIQQYIRQAGQ